jgi:thioredoxin reductase
MEVAIADWDVLVVGAGPAGLSAALILGRCCRRVLLCDTGTPRSFASHEMHGFVSRDGVDPNAFRAIARNQLRNYPNVEFEAVEVTRIAASGTGRFEFDTPRGGLQTARKVLLATGVFDQLPELPGIDPLFGVSVHPCPYCDGWEMKDRRIAVYGRGQRGFEMARAMTAWVTEMVLCTDHDGRLTPIQLAELKANNIEVVTEKIERLVGDGSQLQAIRFTSGREIPCEALFFDTPCHPQSDLAKQLGCRMTRSGAIHCGEYEASSTPGVFVAGNILKDVQLSIVAAGEGARAAFGINRSLTREDFARRAGGFRAASGDSAHSDISRGNRLTARRPSRE